MDLLLSKVRAQQNSGLENQKQPAILLKVVEDTITDQNEHLSPIAYFGTLMSFIEQSQQSQQGESSILVSATYLLAIIFPFISTSILKLKFTNIASVLEGVLRSYKDNAPVIKSIITCLEQLLCAQDTTNWASSESKVLLTLILSLTVDERPKVRKRATDAVRKILLMPPLPSIIHPCSILTIDFSLEILLAHTTSLVGHDSKKKNSNSNTTGNGEVGHDSKKKNSNSNTTTLVGHDSKKKNSNSNSMVLDLLVFLKVLIPIFIKQSRNPKVGKKLSVLTKTLLTIPAQSSGSGNVLLTQWVFEVLSILVSPIEKSNGTDPNISLPTKVEFKVLFNLTNSLLQLSPNSNDGILTPSWLAILSNSFSRLSEYVCDHEIQAENYAAVDIEERGEESGMVADFAKNLYPKFLSQFFVRIFNTFITSSIIKPAIIQKSTLLLANLINCISNTMVISYNDQSNQYLQQILGLIVDSLSSIHSRDQWGYILQISTQVFNVYTTNQRFGEEDIEITNPLLVSMMAFRDDKSYGSSFPFKNELDDALSAAVQSIGLSKFATLMPLHLEDEVIDQPRRPYLISLFATALQSPLRQSRWSMLRVTGNQSLQYYTLNLIPVADRMLIKSGQFWKDDRQTEAKLYETLGTQIWGLFPLIASSLPNDLSLSFGILAAHLGKILTVVPDLLYPSLPSIFDFRPVICQGLENLVESFHRLQSLQVEGGDDVRLREWKVKCNEVGREAVDKIKEYSNRFLSALCNIYISVIVPPTQGKKTTSQTLQILHEKSIIYFERPIKKFLMIAPKEAIGEYMLTLIKSILEKQTAEKLSDVDRLSIYSMFDLILILIPNLGNLKDFKESPIDLFYQLCVGQLLTGDANLQKRTYKSLTHILEHTSYINLADLATALQNDKVTTKVSSGASRPRLKLIQSIALKMRDPSDLLRFVPAFVPEVMLATKEASEKTRELAYECLVAIARKMMDGPKGDDLEFDINLNRVDLDYNSNLNSVNGQDVVDGDDDVNLESDNVIKHKGEVSMKEFMMMVVAGLAGSSTHMQSATIASLGRLLFEFSDQLEADLIHELVKTILICMEFKNREVAKAALGFIKVAVVCLSAEILESDVEAIVTCILTHSKDHKAHFKSKVRHIFERLIRKYSYEAIDQYFPEDDKKLILNIKKRKESLKRRKQASRLNEVEEDTENTSKPAKGKAFGDVFHDSGSELDSDEEIDDDFIPDRFKQDQGDRKLKQVQTIIREDDVVDFLDKNVISQVTQVRGSKKNTTRDEFKTNSDGRLLLQDSDDEDNETRPVISEDYYKQSLASEVAFTRTADGRVKFAKRKRTTTDTGEIDVDPNAGKRWNASKKKVDKPIDDPDMSKMLGRQYKAKKASGDVKRAGMADPHAFIPLSGKIVGGMKKSTKIDGTLKNILKAAHKGSDVGAKNRNRVKGISKANKKHNK